MPRITIVNWPVRNKVSGRIMVDSMHRYRYVIVDHLVPIKGLPNIEQTDFTGDSQGTQNIDLCLDGIPLESRRPHT